MQNEYGALPLRFEVNRGQAGSRVKFVARGSGYALFLGSPDALLALKGNENNESRRGRADVVRIQLVGANRAARVAALDELPGKANYFIGNDPKQWQTNIATFARVKYDKVYPGIDLVYYGKQQQLEYDFHVSPGADAAVIALAFNGARSLEIDAEGDLIVGMPGGAIRWRRPAVYQEVDGTRVAVASKYVLKGASGVGFEIDAFDVTKPLVIDPILDYSTYLGGIGGDAGLDIAVDAFGGAYVTGVTASIDDPGTPAAEGFPLANPRQGLFGGGTSDAFVTKLNAAGSAVEYSTYVGGAGADAGVAVAVDAGGNAYVTGHTESADFPVANAFQSGKGAGNDVFALKLNAIGSALDYASYLGGEGTDLGRGIAVDGAGYAYVTGVTSSNSFPATPGALQTMLGGSSDAFVAVVAPPQGAIPASLSYATYLGGSRDDAAFAIAIDTSGNAYITGATTSLDEPATAPNEGFPLAQPLQSTIAGLPDASGNLSADLFVAKLGTTAPTLHFSTYLGGAATDEGRAIAVDSAGSVYITGVTNSSAFPTANAYQSAYGGGQCAEGATLVPCFDAFVVKMAMPTDVAPASVAFSTYLGGRGADAGLDIALDVAGNIHLSGFTNSVDDPATVTNEGFPLESPVQPAFGGGASDAFVAKLDATGSALLHSTYLGGGDSDEARGVAADAFGDPYVTGMTLSHDDAATPEGEGFPIANALQPAFGGGAGGIGDAFVAKIFAPAFTCTVSWDGDATNDLWQTATNWSTDALPASTDDVCIGPEFTVTLSSGAQTIHRLQGDGALVIAGGSLSIAAASHIRGSFTLSGGTLTGAGQVVASGASVWTGGAMTGAGKTVIPASGTLTIRGAAAKVVAARTIENAGTTTWTGDSPGADVAWLNGAIVNNLSGALFDIRGNAAFEREFVGAAPAFNNAGTVRKSAGTGISSFGGSATDDFFGVIFTNSGAIEVQTGVLRVGRNGTSTGSMTVAAGATLALQPMVLKASSTVSGAGTVNLNGTTHEGSYDVSGLTQVVLGTVTFNSAVSSFGSLLHIHGGIAVVNVPITTPNLTLTDGSLLGIPAVTVTNQLKWTGGVMGGGGAAGAGKTIIPVSATLTIGSGSAKLLSNRLIENAGTTTWSGNSPVCSLTCGPGADVGFQNGAVFNNLAGALFDIRGDAAFEREFVGAAPAFNNAGTVRKSAGTGISSFIGSEETNLAGVRFTNSGSIEVQTGRLRVGDGASTGAMTVAAGATLGLRAMALQAGSIVRGAGTVNLNGTTHEGSYDISGLTQVTLGTVIFNSPVTSFGTGLNILDGTAVFNSPVGSFGSLLHINGGIAEFNVPITTPNLTLNEGGLRGIPPVTVTNRLTWTGGFMGGGGAAGAGKTIIPAGATLTIGSGSPKLLSNRLIENAGTTTWSGNSPVCSLTCGPGADVGLQSGAVFNNLPGALFDIRGNAAFKREFVGAAPAFNNAGTVRKSAGTGISSFTGSEASNFAGVNFANSGSIEVQTGLLRVGDGTSTGAMTVAAGATLGLRAIVLQPGSTVTGAGTVNLNATTHEGTYDLSGITQVALGTVTFNSPVPSFGTRLNILDGRAIFNSPVGSFGSLLHINGGEADFNVPITTPNLTLTEGGFRGIPPVTVTNQLIWTGGFMGGGGAAGAGKTVIPAGATLTIGSGSPKLVSNRLIENAGTTTWTGSSAVVVPGSLPGPGADVDLQSGAVFNNLPGALFDIRGNAAFEREFVGAAPAFNNAGTLRKSAGTGSSSFISIPFNNRGSVEALSGNLRFLGAYNQDQDAGATILNGGSIASSTFLNIDKGTLSGFGTIFAGVRNGGHLHPGLGPGVLTITRGYTQLSTGTLNVEIGGLTAGSTFDQLKVGGTATLNGALNVSLANGFTPAVGDTFPILTFSSRTGSFATYNGLNLGDGRTFRTIYNPNDLTLLLGALAPCAMPSFATSVTSVVGQLPRAIATGDVNRDRKPDLAIANATSNSVSILLGDGTGAFTAPVTLATGLPVTLKTGVAPSAVAFGDFNRDGKLDLAVTNENSNTVSILLGRGNGTFGARKDFRTGAKPASVAVADFNRDNRPDLAVANTGSNTVSILFGNGTGGFALPRNVALGAAPVSITVADLNLDNFADFVVAAGVADRVIAALGNGRGGFGTIAHFLTGSRPSSVTTGDFNKDGRPDLAVANALSDDVSVLLGDGTGAFGPVAAFAAGSAPSSVAVADFNGDEKDDLAIANQRSNDVSILIGDGSGAFGAPVNMPVGSEPAALATGEFNRDGKFDVAVANSGSGNTSILLNDCTGEPVSDLSLTKRHVGTFTVGQNGEYTVVVTNVGSSATTERITVTDELPIGLDFVSATGGAWSCSAAAALVTCDHNGPLAPGESAILTLTVAVSAEALPSVLNTATVSNAGDRNPLNDSDTDRTDMSGTADLAISVDDSIDPATPGIQLTYTISVVNNGPQTANAVGVIDVLPPSVTLVSATASQGSCTPAGADVSCDLQSLEADAEATVSIVVTLNETGEILNTASVTATEPDPDPSNNTDTQITSVEAIRQATVTLSGLNQVYDGTPKAVIAETDPAGLAVELVYSQGGVAVTVPTNAGTYQVDATIVEAGFEGSASAILTIDKATPTVHVTGGTFTYDGAPHPATGTVTGVGGEVLGTPTFTYNGMSTVPVNAGTYAVVATFLGSENYAPASDSSAAIVIDKASPIVLVTGGVFVFDGAPHPAVGEVIGVAGTTIGVPMFTYRRVPDGIAVVDAPLAAGIYAVVATFGGNENYTAAAASTTIVINEPPTITGITGPTAVLTPGGLATIRADFVDPATGDQHTCTFDWGDGTTTTVSVTTAGSGFCQATHSYVSPGVYAVTVIVTDDDGLSARKVFESVVVSSLTGTVSGGGSLLSGVGAYPAHPALTGTATFTINVRYGKNATVPSGITSFNFAAAGLSLSASSYYWLVVKNGTAWYRGSGFVTINGVSERCEFLIAAIDGPNFTADKLRVKIWIGTRIVYDNLPSASDGADPEQIVDSGPGSIVVRLTQ